MRTGFRHVYAGFGKGLIWTTAPFTACLMRHARELGLKEADAAPPDFFNVLYGHSVYIREDRDRAFNLELFAVRPRRAAPPTITCFGPDGKRVLEWTGPPPQAKLKRTYETFALRVPKDGVTGTYRFDVKAPSMWRFSYRCDLPGSNPAEGPKLVMKGGIGGTAKRHFFVPKGTQAFRVIVKGTESRPRLRCALSIRGPDGTEEAGLVWWKRAPSRKERFTPHVVEIRPAKEKTGKVWSLHRVNLPYVTLEGIPPYLAMRPEACFIPER